MRILCANIYTRRYENLHVYNSEAKCKCMHRFIFTYLYICDFHCDFLCMNIYIYYIYSPGNTEVHEAYMTRASSQGRQHLPRKQDLRQKMMKEPEYEELNIERPNNYNDLNNKHEQLCFREYRPFKCSEPGKVDDDAYLAYDRLLVEILTWLILKRKHLLKFEIKSSIQQIFF